jgi:hypothetical protein
MLVECRWKSQRSLGQLGGGNEDENKALVNQLRVSIECSCILSTQSHFVV